MSHPLPCRTQFELLTYDGRLMHPVLFLQPEDPFDHLGLFRLLASAGLALPAAWEWRGGLWPFSVTCRLELTGEPTTVLVLAHDRPVTAGLPPAEWAEAVVAGERALVVLLPPDHEAGDIETIAVQQRRRACLAGSVAAGQRADRRRDR
jgi:hypothetical protein